MTVKELKEKLNEFDDNLIVLLPDESKEGIWPWTDVVNLSQGVNEADGCLFIDNYEEDDSEEENHSTGCRHEWFFQETQRKCRTSNYGSGYTAHFERVDLYYCKHCCETMKKEQKSSVILPFGGIHHPENYAPVWY